MKKHLLFLSVFLFCWTVVSGQILGSGTIEHKQWSEVPELSDYDVIFRAVDAECYNGGGVDFSIIRKDTRQPITPDEFANLHLSNFRISHTGISVDTTEIHAEVEYDPTQPWTHVQMEKGEFRVEMECVIDLGNNVRYSVLKDTTLTINLNYTEPSIKAIGRRSQDGIELGRIASLECEPTGRLQVRILGGKMPYDVVVSYPDGTVYRTVRFEDYQHTGTDSMRADFMYYYTFDDMPVGEWNFDLTDNCGTHPLSTGQIVETMPLPQLDKIQIFASTGNIKDSNIVKINAVVNTNNEYYARYYASLFGSLMEYRFYMPGYRQCGALKDTLSTPWTALPYTGNKTITLYDTISRANDYCDFFCEANNRPMEIKFQFRAKKAFPNCPGWDTTVTFYYLKPTNFTETYGYEVDEIFNDLSNPCSGSSVRKHTDNYEIYAVTYDKNHLTDWNDNPDYTYHFTYPVVWEYLDMATGGTVIKRDTITSNFREQHSVLSYADFVAMGLAPETFQDFQRDRVTVRLLDAHGCVLYIEENKTYTFATIPPSVGSGPDWTYDRTMPECCEETRSIKIYEVNGSNVMNYDGLTITLHTTPDQNLYTFKAIYHATTMTWEITDKKVGNFATIMGSPDGRSLTFSDACLPSGNYLFEITNAPCVGTKNLDVWLRGIVTSGTSREPRYEIREECNAKYIKFVDGEIAQFNTYISDDDNTNSNVIVQTRPLPTLFQVVGGPLGGYDPSDHTVYHLNDSLRISFPTTPGNPYRIRIFPDKGNYNLCENYADTFDVYFEGRNLTFDFANALLCSAESDTGTAYVKAKYGIPPYTYTLYSQADKQGDSWQIVTESADDVAVFESKPMSTSSFLSCEVVDACGQSFYLNFPPRVLADLQVTWFNPTVKHTCEGDAVTIFALQMGMVFNYEWKDPDGNVFSNGPDATVMIPRGSTPGEYTVIISQTGCQNNLYDTVEITPEKSPAVSLSQSPGGEVCPGETVYIHFTPEASVDDYSALISFDVVYEDLYGITKRSYSGHHHEDIVDSIVANTFTKIYPVHIEETIGECQYNHADPGDTSYVRIRPDRVDPCKIWTQDALICQGGDTALFASSTELAPYTIRWYTDFELTNMVQENTITSNNDVARYALPHLMSEEIRYVGVYKDGKCPTSNVAPNGVINMVQGGRNEVQCSDEFLFYDEGGRDGDYPPGESRGSVITHLFIGESGHPLMMHFNKLDISPTSHIIIFSGSRPIPDSTICTISQEDSALSIRGQGEVITTHCDTMLVYFVPGEIGGAGWEAVVMPTPGIAIGDVILPAVEMHQDWVCQSQLNQYEKPDITDLDVVDQETLNEAVKKYGTYQFMKTLDASTGCDSTVLLTLHVEAAAYKEITVVTTNKTGYNWHDENGQDSIYYEAGTHVINIPDEKGCDHLDVLNLIVVKIDNPDVDFCAGDSVTAYFTVEVDDAAAKPKNSLLEQRHAVGDVYYWNPRYNRYEIMRPDSFLLTTGMYPVGVVCYMDNDNVHGKVISLVDACVDKPWAAQSYATTVVSLTKAADGSDYDTPRRDKEGMKNTIAIRNSTGWVEDDGITTDNVTRFKERAPAAYYCYFYDPFSRESASTPYGWYLPAAGEFAYCYANRVTINETLKKLSERFGAEILHGGSNEQGGSVDDGYWTSTGGTDNNKAIHINCKGQVHLGHFKYRTYNGVKHTRAMFAF